MSEVPQITDERLTDLYSRIKPVARFSKGAKGKFHDDRGKLYWIEDVDPRNIAFTWDPTPAKRAKKLESIDTIVTLHTYGYHGFFKPSVAEVLAQIPEKYINKTAAFETTYAGMRGSVHVGQTELYKRR